MAVNRHSFWMDLGHNQQLHPTVHSGFPAAHPPLPYRSPSAPLPLTFRSLSAFCGHFLWTFLRHFMWTLFVDTFCGHFLWKLFWTLFVDIFLGQFVSSSFFSFQLFATPPNFFVVAFSVHFPPFLYQFYYPHWSRFSVSRMWYPSNYVFITTRKKGGRTQNSHFSPSSIKVFVVLEKFRRQS